VEHRGLQRQVFVAGVEHRGLQRQVFVAGVEHRGPQRQVFVAGVERVATFDDTNLEIAILETL
jgi:hypothetical protein